MTSGNGASSLFLPQTHPKLLKLGSKEIQTFLERRAEYLLKVKTEYVIEESTFKPASLVNSVDCKLLKALVAFDNFPGVTTVSDLTDDVLLTWLKSQVESIETIKPEKLQALVRKTVSINMQEPDAKMRLMILFTDYYTFLEERKLEGIIIKNTEMAVKHICALLRPYEFKRKIENDLVQHQTDLTKNWKEFYGYVLEKYVEFREYYPSAPIEESSSVRPRAIGRRH